MANNFLFNGILPKELELKIIDMKFEIELNDNIKSIRKTLVDGIEQGEIADEYYPHGQQTNFLIYIGGEYKTLLMRLDRFQQNQINLIKKLELSNVDMNVIKLFENGNKKQLHLYINNDIKNQINQIESNAINNNFVSI
uniref:Uncharacterized protein n=1 Tax=viral metagenome TaxID=1070528 RepID=A0A6C0F7U7_9ZZZZ|tara:strand:+ start:19996 stop:20412 length:417 start_codon:yes stop_codon:yes gene_type:complete